MTQRKGRVTIPTDLDVVPQTLEMLDKWGADAIRDCDGTEFPENSKIQEQKFMLRIIQPEKIISGQKKIQMKYSRCIL